MLSAVAAAGDCSNLLENVLKAINPNLSFPILFSIHKSRQLMII